MKQPIDQLKQWFSRHKFPTQQQFWDWMDSYWHKDEVIPAGRIGGLQQIFDGATAGFGVSLAAKQDKRDNNLHTDSKTVVDAINEVMRLAESCHCPTYDIVITEENGTVTQIRSCGGRIEYGYGYGSEVFIIGDLT